MRVLVVVVFTRNLPAQSKLSMYRGLHADLLMQMLCFQNRTDAFVVSSWKDRSSTSARGFAASIQAVCAKAVPANRPFSRQHCM